MENISISNRGTLYIVGTPIGNLGDITMRGLETLKSTDIIYAEDSRNARKLLTHFGIDKNIYTLHQHTNVQIFDDILLYLLSGKDVVYVSDAGTPGIADPAAKLINYLLDKDASIKVSPVPGVSALSTLISVAGLHENSFYFLGFMPKKKHTSLFSKLVSLNSPFVFFDSPHRVVKSLNEVLSVFGEETIVVVGREMTKMFETFYRGDIKTVINQLSSKSVKGELSVVVIPKNSIK